MISVDDARLSWLILGRNIGHAIGSVKGSWYWTACGTMTPNGVVQQTKPARICRKCRKVLATETCNFEQ